MSTSDIETMYTNMPGHRSRCRQRGGAGHAATRLRGRRIGASDVDEPVLPTY